MWLSSAASAQTTGKRLGALRDPQPFQEHALGGQTGMGHARAPQRASASKSTCAVRSACARMRQRIVHRGVRAPPATYRPASASRRSPRSARRRRGARSGRRSAAMVAAAGAQVSTMSPGLVSASRCASSAAWRGGTEAEAPARPSVSPTCRSRQPSPSRWNWRIGRASKNSLAIRNSGASGRAAAAVDPVRRVTCQRLCLPRAQDRRGLDQVQPRGLVKPRHPARGAQRVGHQRAAPRPQLGQRERAPGGPGPSRPAPAHSPINSPNIWLISGAVVKSPAAPNGSRVA